MLKNRGKERSRGTILGVIVLGVMLSGCGLANKWLPIESGVYRPESNAAMALFIESLEINRENQLATFHLADGSRAVLSFSSRDEVDWLIGCPANIGSTYMEFVDIDKESLSIAGITFEDPILVRDCPSDPERIALREDGPVGGGGACTNTSKCLHFARQAEVTAVLTAAIVNAKPLPRSMKGYELYSWHDEGGDSWRFTLITGTNRLKTGEEIIAEENQVTQSEWVKITADGMEALTALLKRLPPGTELFWLDDERLEGVGELTASITLPEANVVETVDKHCRQLDIQLHASQ